MRINQWTKTVRFSELPTDAKDDIIEQLIQELGFDIEFTTTPDYQSAELTKAKNGKI